MPVRRYKETETIPFGPTLERIIGRPGGDHAFLLIRASGSFEMEETRDTFTQMRRLNIGEISLTNGSPDTYDLPYDVVFFDGRGRETARYTYPPEVDSPAEKAAEETLWQQLRQIDPEITWDLAFEDALQDLDLETITPAHIDQARAEIVNATVRKSLLHGVDKTKETPEIS